MSKEKNAQIKATLLATKKRRETQKCFVFSTKIDYHKLNKLQTAFDSLYKSATETGNLIGGFMRYLSRESAGQESRVKSNTKNRSNS